MIVETLSTGRGPSMELWIAELVSLHDPEYLGGS